MKKAILLSSVVVAAITAGVGFYFLATVEIAPPDEAATPQGHIAASAETVEPRAHEFFQELSSSPEEDSGAVPTAPTSQVPPATLPLMPRKSTQAVTIMRGQKVEGIDVGGPEIETTPSAEDRKSVV